MDEQQKPEGDRGKSPFKNLSDSERQKKARQMRKERREKLRELDDEELADQLEYYRENSFGLERTAQRHKDGPVYDSILWFVMLPEAIERLRGDDE